MSAPTTLTHSDYTVGWICAIDTERIAACELLEEDHPPLPGQPHDDNAYSFGRIGSHNIVIAGLPKGKYGVASAAIVAKDLRRSFPSIRIGLMVGIGGGAPSPKHDIRLGDVVVSSPVGKTGGVIHYNFGKLIQDEEFQYTGSLNAPPTALLTALHNLSAVHARKGHRISESVAAMVQRNRRIKAQYEFPGAENDRLYVSSCVHVHRSQPCAEVCGDGSLITRKPRPADQDDPAIHYGLIASADKLMKDAVVRDTLAKEHDVLCFEMEAAGLMNDFPCVVIRGICDYSDTHKNDQWQGYAAATAAAYAKELLQAMPGEQVVIRNPVVTTGQRSVPSTLQKPIFSVPFERDMHFVGREAIMAQIDERLQQQHRVALSAWGGMGKSQIAIEYAYRFQQSHPESHVLWVYAATSTRFYDAYKDIARQLKLPGHDDQATDPRKLVLDWLDDEDSQWLMILDNADDVGLFFPSHDVGPSSKEISTTGKPLISYLPSRISPKKSLLITTRREGLGEDLSHGGQCIQVPPFDVHEARLLLQHRSRNQASGHDSPESAKLLCVLGYIPLAITQAAAFMRQNRMTLPQYLAALEKDSENMKDYFKVELQDARRDRGFPNSVFQTWKLSFHQIEDQEPEAAGLLSLMAMLDRNEIPEWLLQKFNTNDASFRTSIGTLLAYALIVQEAGSATFAMHRLVQLSIHDWLEQAGKRVEFEEQALQLLSYQFPSGSYKTWKTCRSLYPHAQAVLQCDLKGEPKMIDRSALLYHVGNYEKTQGLFEIAEVRALEALAIDEKVLGGNHIDTLRTRHLLGVVLMDQGKYNESEKIHERTLRLRKTILGKEHPETLGSMTGLATVLTYLGKCEEAESLHKQTLQLNERIRGKEHPDTLKSVHNVAAVLGDQGKYGEAEGMYRQTLKLKVEILGEGHPSTLISMSGLASVLESQFKYNEAEEMSQQTLKLSETTLGKKHPNTLTSMHNLAIIYGKQGKYEGAAALYLETLDLKETVIGKKHPNTPSTVWGLAHLYRIQKRHDVALSLYQRASAGLRNALGPDHPDTKRCTEKYRDLLKEMESRDRKETAGFETNGTSPSPSTIYLGTTEEDSNAKHVIRVHGVRRVWSTWKESIHLKWGSSRRKGSNRTQSPSLA